jgi:Flp pilus assembly protein protease CpaA
MAGMVAAARAAFRKVLRSILEGKGCVARRLERRQHARAYGETLDTAAVLRVFLNSSLSGYTSFIV